MPITVRTVSAAALHDLRHRILRHDHPKSAALFEGDDEPQSVHFGAFDGDTLVGCATLHRRPFDEQVKEAWQLRGMAVDDGQRGSGVGSLILAAVDAHVAQSPLSKFLWCHARAGAIRFYRNNGWKTVSEEYLIGTLPHYRMVKDLSTSDRHRSASEPRGTHSAPASESR